MQFSQSVNCYFRLEASEKYLVFSYVSTTFQKFNGAMQTFLVVCKL